MDQEQNPLPFQDLFSNIEMKFTLVTGDLCPNNQLDDDNSLKF